MPKNKNKNRKSEKFTHQLHFLKSVVSNTRCFWYKSFYTTINITSAFYSI